MTYSSDEPENETDYLYGINPAFEAVRAKKRDVLQAWINQASGNPRLKKLERFLRDQGVPVHQTDKHQLFNRCKTRENQGVVLEASPYPYHASADLWESKRLLLIDNVEDPQNVGAILRSAEVFGFHHVLLPIKGVPQMYGSVVKASAGATEHLSIARDCGANTYFKQARERGLLIVALDASGKASLNDVADDLKDRAVLLVIGGEDKGVGRFILNEADRVVGIEQRGQINSLNASVAAGIALHALRA
jgi:23S rRNA (guanosine2251-2'-O)-methyltransferase